MGRDRPAAAARGFRQGDRLVQRAARRQGLAEAGELAAVGALHDQRHRHVGQRHCRGIAQHGHELHRLARAVDAALGVEEGIDRAGLVAAGHAAVGEVERRLAELEPRKILLGGIGRHHRAGAGSPAALEQAGGEQDAAGLVGHRLGHRLVAARQQGDFEVGERLGGLQRADEDVQAVVAGEGGQRDVGVHHPHAGRLAAAGLLLRLLIAGGRRLGGVPGDDEIGAGLPVLHGFADREGGGHRLVGDVAHLHGAAPLQRAIAAVQPAVERIRFGDRLAARIGGVVAVAGEAHDGALVDAIDRDADLADVDGGDRQAGGAAARQDEALAGQGDHGGPGAQRHLDVLVLVELDAVAAREARAQPHLVVLAIGQAADAQPIVDHAQRRLHLGRDRHVVGIVDVAGRQRLVEGEAGLAFGAAVVEGEAAIGEGLVRCGGGLRQRNRRRRGRGGGGARRCHRRGRSGGRRRRRRSGWCRSRRRRLRYGGGSGWCIDPVGGPPDQVARNPRSQHESHDQSSQRRPIHANPRKSDRTLFRRLCKHCGVWTSARESSSVWRAYHAFWRAVDRPRLSGPAIAY